MDWTDGWHFCRADGRLGRDDGRPIVVGETLTVAGPLELCRWGLHASREARAALSYAPKQSRLCRVRLGGEINYGPDKAVATERTCMAMLSERETAVLLRRWAVWCVRQVAHLLTDERSLHPLSVTEAWCNGAATNEDLEAANNAALAVAEAAASAARDTAEAADRGARDTTEADAWAAGAAAWAAKAAAYAALAVAVDAARFASRAAAWAAWNVKDAQHQQLGAMCLEAIGAAPARGG